MSIGHFRALYQQEYDFGCFPEQARAHYVIATTPRSGSTLLAHKLWQSGRMGAPLEYLNLPRQADLIERIGAATIEGYAEHLVRIRTSPNGVFATKIFYLHAHKLQQHYTPFDRLIKPDAFLFLFRRDKLAQSVSLSKAMQTEAWTESATQSQTPRYHFEHLFKCHEYLRWQEAGWCDLMTKTGARVMSLSYEDFAEDQEGTLTAIEAFIGVHNDEPAKVDIPLPARQGNASNNEWVTRFKADLDAGLADRIDQEDLYLKFPDYGGSWLGLFN